MNSSPVISFDENLILNGPELPLNPLIFGILTVILYFDSFYASFSFFA